jgi:5-methylcytosine-specific restriction endonuclease McrA
VASRKRQAENRERRRVVVEAFGTDPECFVCGRPADDAHELLSRARGGSITDVSGIRPVCRGCHNRITTEPAWAAEHGYALSRYTPTKETL